MPGEKVEDNLNYAEKKMQRQTAGSIESILKKIEKAGTPQDFEKLESLIPGSTRSIKKGTMSLYGLNRSVINKFLKSSKDI
jgi:hypothetical protein